MSFIEAELDSQSVPRALEVGVAVTDPVQDFSKGALGRLTDADPPNFVEATSPAAGGDVAYVAQGPFGPAPTSGPFAGFGDIGGRKGHPSGRVVVTDAAATKFRAQYDGSLPAVTGGTFDAILDTDGLWKVDFGSSGDLVRYLGVIPRLDLAAAVESPATQFMPYEVLVEFVAAGVATAKAPVAEASL